MKSLHDIESLNVRFINARSQLSQALFETTGNEMTGSVRSDIYEHHGAFIVDLEHALTDALHESDE